MPLLGILGGGLNIGRDAAKDSNLTQIYRHAAAAIAANTNPTTTPADIYFTYAAEKTTNGDANAVYKLTFTNFTPPSSDAATGLIARRQWKLEVFSPPGSSNSIDKMFIMRNRDPVEMKNEFP